MKLTHGYTPAPKKQRYIIFADNSGRLTARPTTHGKNTAWLVTIENLKTQGFTPIGQFNLPYRYHLKGNGYMPAVQHFYKRLVRHYSL